jgi:hypothetical protein
MEYWERALATQGFDRIPVSDVHCHPWRVADLLALPSASFEDRLAMVGMCQITSGADNGLGSQIARMSGETWRPAVSVA